MRAFVAGNRRVFALFGACARFARNMGLPNASEANGTSLHEEWTSLDVDEDSRFFNSCSIFELTLSVFDVLC